MVPYHVSATLLTILYVPSQYSCCMCGWFYGQLYARSSDFPPESVRHKRRMRVVITKSPIFMLFEWYWWVLARLIQWLAGWFAPTNAARFLSHQKLSILFRTSQRIHLVWHFPTHAFILLSSESCSVLLWQSHLFFYWFFNPWGIWMAPGTTYFLVLSTQQFVDSGREFARLFRQITKRLEARANDSMK